MERMLSHDKSGMATVLGMLIFVGVLFTCIIPLFLYVNEVNSIYDRAVADMRLFDQERQREDIDVYAYPVGDPRENLSIYIKNKSPISVTIVRVWVNDNVFNNTREIPAMADGTIESIDISHLLPPTETETFNIKVTTNRGNIFTSHTNPLYYTGGFWSGGMGFTIQVVIEAGSGGGTRFFHINITRDGDPNYFYEADIVKRPHESSCFNVISVVVADTYHVAVTEGQNELVPIPESVTVDSSHPSKWVYVYA